MDTTYMQPRAQRNKFKIVRYALLLNSVAKWIQLIRSQEHRIANGFHDLEL